MKVDLLFTHIPITDEKLKDHIVVVIDVLRASTTICEALKNGAREIIPTDNVPSAIELAENLSRDNLLLCGEREGKKIEGFDLGNSPSEYTPEIVKGKSLIYCSTNGSITIAKTHAARRTLIAGFVNVSACIDYIIENGGDKLLFVCSGNNQQFSLEDAVCGGLMIDHLQKMLGENYTTTDGTEAAHLLFAKYQGDYVKLLTHCNHGQYLQTLGMGDDIEICAAIDSIANVPIYSQGEITLELENNKKNIVN